MIVLGKSDGRTEEDMIDLANCMGFVISDDNRELYRKWIVFTGDEDAEDELKRFRKHYSNMLWLFTLTDDELNHICNEKYGHVVVHPRSKFKELDGYSVVDVQDGSATCKFYEFFINTELFATDEGDHEEEIRRKFLIKLVEASDPRRVYNRKDRSNDLINRLPTKVEVVMKNDTDIYGIAGYHQVIRVD